MDMDMGMFLGAGKGLGMFLNRTAETGSASKGIRLRNIQSPLTVLRVRL
jgi:hypothetical protein